MDFTPYKLYILSHYTNPTLNLPSHTHTHTHWLTRAGWTASLRVYSGVFTVNNTPHLCFSDDSFLYKQQLKLTCASKDWRGCLYLLQWLQYDKAHFVCAVSYQIHLHVISSSFFRYTLVQSWWSGSVYSSSGLQYISVVWLINAPDSCVWHRV